MPERLPRPPGINRLLNPLRRLKRRLAFEWRWLLGRRTPWCGWLYSCAYVTAQGHVYACCHYGPRRLGNIHDEPLETIWRGAAWRRCRRRNAQGRLPCAEGCRAVLYYADDVPPARRRDPALDTPPYARLRRLHIEFGRRCNLACIMCEQDHGDRTTLDWRRARERIDHSPVELVDVQGGEPLLIPDARHYLAWAAAAGKSLQVLTNGTLMSRPLAATLMASPRLLLNISINAATRETHERVNAGSRWEQVLRTVRLLRDAQRAAGNTTARIIAHMTIVPENVREIPLFIRRFADLGFDRANFCFDQRTVPGWLRAHPEARAGLQTDIAAALAAIPDSGRVDTEQLALLGLASPHDG